MQFHTWTPKDGQHHYPKKDIQGILNEKTARFLAMTEAQIRQVDMQMWEKRLEHTAKWEKCGVVGVPHENPKSEKKK